jgi:uncharacterized protein (TIGR03437 family)
MFRIILLLLLLTPAGFAANPTQPSIPSDGIVNAASYLSRGFSNGGIARGSLFLIFGSYLGPDTLAQASFPLPTQQGLAGTYVRVNSGGYTAFAPIVYTSAKQVAAIMPSNAPEGDATVSLNYNNLTSNPVVVHVVRSGFGIFTLNQAGSGQAIAQNFIGQNLQPLNTLLTSATPGQTLTLWGTGLGPVTGDETGGPLPGALPYLDTLYVGGQPANVRYAGRSGCCAAVDQIVFDVPQNVTGCYVPVAAVSAGVVSNLGTISIASSGGLCDDPVSFRASDLAGVAAGSRLRLAQISLRHQGTTDASMGSNSFSATFSSYTPQVLTTAVDTINPTAGTCYVSETPVGLDPSSLPHGDPLNPGFAIVVGGPVNMSATAASPGNYAVSMSPAALPAGNYAVTAQGGPDIGSFRAAIAIGSGIQWTNPSDFSGSVVPTGQTMTFRWTGGDSGSYTSIQITSASTDLKTSIQCNVPSLAGAFTVPSYLTRTIVQGQGSIAVGWFGQAVPFSAQGLDVARVVAGLSTVQNVNFQMPAQ